MHSPFTPSRRRILLGAAAAGVPLLASPGLPRAQQGGGGAAAAWPDRPIRAIVPFAAGGTTDVVARVVAEAAGQALGQSVVVENRTGAGLVVGTEVAARAEPDGTTVLITASPHVNTPSLVARLPYDPVNDFRAVAMAGATPQLFCVTARLPAQTLAEFVALIRANPGRYAYASAGVGSAIHVASLLFLAETRAEMLHVPYRGGGPAMQSVIGGETHLVMDPIASAAPHVRGGSVRALAVATGRRSPVLPEVPTTDEAGLPGFRAEAWIAVLAPARVPPARMQRLQEGFAQGIRSARERLAALSVQPMEGTSTPEEVEALIRREIPRIGAVLKAAGVQPE
jgi:tripartite-type tricarboxylate transporter receptor subunit TctC